MDSTLCLHVDFFFITWSESTRFSVNTLLHYFTTKHSSLWDSINTLKRPFLASTLSFSGGLTSWKPISPQDKAVNSKIINYTSASCKAVAWCIVNVEFCRVWQLLCFGQSDKEKNNQPTKTHSQQILATYKSVTT